MIVVATGLAAEHPIDNRTTSLEVVSIRGTATLQVVLRNTSKKPIETLMVGMDDWTYIKDVNLLRGGMPPGTRITLDVQPPQGPGPHDFRVFAAIFSDKAAEGDATAIGEILDNRSAKKQVYARTLSLIERTERDRSSSLRLRFNELIRRIAKLPESAGAARTLRDGIAAELLRGSSQESDESLRARLTTLKNQCRLFANSL